MYTVAFRDGENIHSTEESYYFADSLVDDGNGKQVLDPKTTKKVKKIEWFNEHKNYENKYYCSNLTCDKVYYVTLTAPNLFVRLDISNNYKYGSSFIYDNSTGEYTLNGKVQNFLEWGAENSDAKLENTHYTCWNSEGKCKTLSYIYNIQGVNMNNVPISNISPYYFELNSGKDIETIINEMLYANDVNKYNSAIKSVIDLWYSKYMRQYTKYLEDTVWCNERSISNMNENGLNKDGGGYKSEIKFSAYTDNKENLTCLNEIDRFTVDKMNGNGALTYPVGLITEQERKMAFQYSTKESPIMSKSVSWLNSPYYYRYGNAYGNYLAQDGDDSYYGRDYIGGLMGVRPSISLKNGVTYNSGDGSIEAPYVIEIDH